jgi:cell division septal protein FtsQ
VSRDAQTTRRGLPTAGVPVPSDRRFRRADASPVRRRRAGRTILAIARWTAVAMGLVLIATWGGQRLVASDMFVVRDITVRGNARLSAGDVESLLTGLREENVFLVDFEHYRQQVMDSTWVEQVTLSRVLPATIVVDIVERTPMVIARLNQQLYLVDRTGNIIDEYRAEHHGFDLPVVDGLLTASKGDDAAIDPERVGVTASLLDDMASRHDLQERLSQIDVTNPRDVVVMIEDDVAWLHLGQASFVARLQRYLDLRPALLDRFGAIDYADLKFDERIYVRGQGQRAPGFVATK